jgi:hypothetical protein
MKEISKEENSGYVVSKFRFTNSLEKAGGKELLLPPPLLLTAAGL